MRLEAIRSMIRLSSILLITVLLVSVIFMNLAWSEGEREAMKVFHSHPDIKFLTERCECSNSGVPEINNSPFYTFYFKPDPCLNKKGPCEGMGVFTFYMDAKTGKIWSEETTGKKIIAMKESEMELRKSIGKEDLDKVLKDFLSYPDVKFLSDKCGCNHGSVSPRGYNPFYTFYWESKKDCPAEDSYCSQMRGQYFFYMDAKTGKIWCDEETEKEILVMRQADTERENRIKNEISLKEELDRAYAEIDERRFYNDNTYRQLIQKYTPLFIKALGAVTPDIRSHIAHILGQLSNEGYLGQYKVTEAIPQLVMLLKDQRYAVRYEAVWALGNIGERGDKNLVEVIVPLINDSDSLVRRGAIEALGKLGDSSLVPRFIALLEDTAVNQETVRALAHIGDERAVAPLINILNSKRYFYLLERDIIHTLGAIGSKQSIPALINLFNQRYARNEKFDESFQPRVPYMGADAARALADIGKDAVPYLIESLKSQDYLQRLYSVYTLGLIKDSACVESLNEVLTVEGNPTVKTYIEWAIAETKGEEFVSPLSKQLKIETKPSRKKYKLNDGINTFLHIKNAGPAPVVINNIPVQFVEVSYVVFGPDNQPTLYIGPMYDWDPFPKQDNLVTLKAGQDYKAKTFNLQKYYKFDKPGIYKIIGFYSNPFYACGIEFGVYALSGTVKSEPIEIEVE